MPILLFAGLNFMNFADIHENNIVNNKIMNFYRDVINHLRSIFARHGIPEPLTSDNGPQYSAEVLSKFAKEYGFTHLTSSPYHP